MTYTPWGYTMIIVKTKTQRINTIIGQLNGVNDMLSTNSSCEEVLMQLKAIKSSVNSLMDNVIEEQFETCLSTLKNKDKKILKNLKKYVTNN